MLSSRKFLDSGGFAWEIAEVKQREAHDSSGELGWLYFFSRGTTLRLRDYPVDWYDMAWEDLERMAARATLLSSDGVRLPRPHALRPAVSGAASLR